MEQVDLVINADGQISAVWNDALAGLGDARIVRASHVEPTPDGKWTADMGPSGGPVLPLEGPGFTTRAEALQAEREWLRIHRGL